MKLAARIFLALVLVLAVAPDRSGARILERRPQFSGREYVWLLDWARANQFQVRWLDRDKIVQLSNRLARLTLTVNSAEAQINGVAVRLSFPVAVRNGAVVISQLDLEKTFGPVL